MIKNDVTFLSMPTGSVIFACADSKYFKLFGEQLISSLDKVNCFTCLHIHVINPDQETQGLLQLYLRRYRMLTASFEYVSVDALVELARHSKSDWIKKIPLDILEMLALEQVRGKNIQRKIVRVILKLGLSANLCVSKNALQSDAVRVYYACRRFSFIKEIFDKIDSLVVIDIDSVCRNNLFIEKLQSSDVILASKRVGSWSHYLAGFVYYPNNDRASTFIDRYCEKLTEYFENGCIFWGLDQYLLDVVSTKNSTSALHESVFGLKEGEDCSFISYKGEAKYRNI